MPKKQAVQIEADEATQLELKKLLARHSTPQQLALRGRMILAAASGKNTSQIARDLEVSVDTVRSWRTRWTGLQGVPLEDVFAWARPQQLLGTIWEFATARAESQRLQSEAIRKLWSLIPISHRHI